MVVRFVLKPVQACSLTFLFFFENVFQQIPPITLCMPRNELCPCLVRGNECGSVMFHLIPTKSEVDRLKIATGERRDAGKNLAVIDGGGRRAEGLLSRGVVCQGADSQHLTPFPHFFSVHALYHLTTASVTAHLSHLSHWQGWKK